MLLLYYINLQRLSVLHSKDNDNLHMVQLPVILNSAIKLFYSQKPTEYGDILFSLSYLPTAERLTVVIVKARSLRWRNGKDSGGWAVSLNLLSHRFLFHVGRFIDESLKRRIILASDVSSCLLRVAGKPVVYSVLYGNGSRAHSASQTGSSLTLASPLSNIY